MELKFREQSRIDQLVDAVSTAGLSIVSLTRDSLTLEKAFLQLVEESENAEAAANRLA